MIGTATEVAVHWPAINLEFESVNYGTAKLSDFIASKWEITTV
jgi:hypothetical protein